MCYLVVRPELRTKLHKQTQRGSSCIVTAYYSEKSMILHVSDNMNFIVFSGYTDGQGTDKMVTAKIMVDIKHLLTQTFSSDSFKCFMHFQWTNQWAKNFNHVIQNTGYLHMGRPSCRPANWPLSC